MAKNLTNVTLMQDGGSSSQPTTNSGLTNLNQITDLGKLYGIGNGASTPVVSTPNGTYPVTQNTGTNSAQDLAKQAAQQAAQQAAIKQQVNYMLKTAQDVADKVTTNDNANNGAGNTDTGSADYTALLNALYAQQQQNSQALAQQQQQNALDAYNRNMAAMNEAYNTRLGMLGNSFNSAMGLLDSNYAQSQAQQRQSAEDALRQAYINRMMGEKNLTQQLVANGISGGASESARAGLINAYGNNRNAIQRTLADNLASLDSAYINNAHNARQAYNNALADAASEIAGYQTQFSSDLANNNAANYTNLFNQMARLDDTYLGNMADVITNNQTYAQQKAIADELAKSDWRVGYVQDAIGRGMSQAGILAYLRNAGATPEEIADIMNSAGVTLE